MFRVKLEGVTKYHEYEELIKVYLRPDEFEIVESAEDILIPYDPDKNKMKESIFFALGEKTGERPPWGIITGIRPVKLTGEHIEDIGFEATKKKLLNYYHLTEEKANLALTMYRHQMDRFGKASDDSISLYIGIPFCPTRCIYCSFASNQVKGDEIDRYLVALKKEISYAEDFIRSGGLKLESIYIGGGTPTTLDETQLERLLSMVDGLRDIMKGGEKYEYTLEAGRPDTVNIAKMTIAKDHGVGRICINPQSMKDITLEKIGRCHKAEDIERAFEDAGKAGFIDINSDVIAGLPGENIEDFKKTLDKVVALGPTEVTVHSLSVKRASRLVDVDKDLHYKQGDVVTEMLDYSRGFLKGKGYKPYYLYRQKHMSGAQENTGYAKEGFESIYNVRMMDEHQSIMALGAGGVSKVYYPEENRLERVFDLTNYELYIERIEEMIKRKEEEFSKRYR